MIHPLAALALRLSDIRFLRYFGASVAALGVDMSAFFTALALGIAAGPAAALGYSLGIAAHWLISSRAVFHQSVATAPRERTVQKTLFVMSALAGLVVTIVIVAGGAYLGFDPRVAKLMAVGVSFLAVWQLRNRYVFRPASPEMAKHGRP